MLALLEAFVYSLTSGQSLSRWSKPPKRRFRPRGEIWLALEALLLYVLRPPVAQERVEQRPDGLVRITLKKAYADGTS